MNCLHNKFSEIIRDFRFYWSDAIFNIFACNTLLEFLARMKSTAGLLIRCFKVRENKNAGLKWEKISSRRTRSCLRSPISLFRRRAIDFSRRAKNDRVIMQHFPTQPENTSTLYVYAIRVLSRREIRQTAQGSARGCELMAVHLRSFTF